jgi:hypothetical protein
METGFDSQTEANNTPQDYQRCSNRGVTVDVAELVDALGLGSSRVFCGGSSPLIDIDTR